MDYGAYLDGLYAKLRADAARTKTEPTPADMTAADAVFARVVDDWSKRAPGNPALVQAVRDQLAALRAH